MVLEHDYIPHTYTHLLDLPLSLSDNKTHTPETTEGDSEDLYDNLMEMTGWKVTDNENENENDSVLV